MKIGILGTRGIPNRYGGFEQFAEFLAPALVENGHHVTVYCSNNHPYQKDTYKGVHLIRCVDPKGLLGEASQFLYDLLCILDARKRGFDLIYQLGYTTSGLWQFLLPSHADIWSNMDGMEWSRSKYGSVAKKLLKFSEKEVANHSHLLIADAEPIADYLRKKYKAPVEFAAYAAEIPSEPSKALLEPLALRPNEYYLLIARMQPDNHPEEAIRGVLESQSGLPLVVVGNMDQHYGRHLRKTFASASNIKFLGGVFDKEILDSLRRHARLYFHGHSAGGTNPSLLEAMAAGARIVAHDNPFNRSVCHNGALYFKHVQDIASIILQETSEAQWEERIKSNLEAMSNTYSPQAILTRYLDLLYQYASPQKSSI
jgi:glycosyltransferase involved in cell wall biosynthesis